MLTTYAPGMGTTYFRVRLDRALYPARREKTTYVDPFVCFFVKDFESPNIVLQEQSYAVKVSMRSYA